MSLTWTDLFAGLGGSSEGLTQVPGNTVLMAANHWQLAMDSHQANHPDTAHDCADISQVNPRRYPKTDMLWASPECTSHSQARGQRQDKPDVDAEGNELPNEANERSRATMWDVPRFAEVHQYRGIVVENVVDAVLWCPYKQGRCAHCDATGKKGCGSLFNAWLTAMYAAGYNHQLVFVNAMHASQTGLPPGQSRDRKYSCFWRIGDPKPDFDRLISPQAYCEPCGQWVASVQTWKRPDRTWGRYGDAHQYLYSCPRCKARVEPPVLGAETCIDWSLPTRRLADGPLSEKTMARIQKYLDAHPNAGPAQLPLEGRDGKVCIPTSEPHRTLTCRRETGLIIPMRNNNVLKPTDRPFDTLCANGNHASLLIDTSRDVYECLFRMFEKDEMKAAMGFGEDYIVLGNKREKQRLIGNAVCVQNARDIGQVYADAYAG